MVPNYGEIKIICQVNSADFSVKISTNRIKPKQCQKNAICIKKNDELKVRIIAHLVALTGESNKSDMAMSGNKLEK